MGDTPPKADGGDDTARFTQDFDALELELAQLLGEADAVPAKAAPAPPTVAPKPKGAPPQPSVATKPGASGKPKAAVPKPAAPPASDGDIGDSLPHPESDAKPPGSPGKVRAVQGKRPGEGKESLAKTVPAVKKSSERLAESERKVSAEALTQPSTETAGAALDAPHSGPVRKGSAGIRKHKEPAVNDQGQNDDHLPNKPKAAPLLGDAGLQHNLHTNTNIPTPPQLTMPTGDTTKTEQVTSPTTPTFTTAEAPPKAPSKRTSEGKPSIFPKGAPQGPTIRDLWKDGARDDASKVAAAVETQRPEPVEQTGPKGHKHVPRDDSAPIPKPPESIMAASVPSLAATPPLEKKSVVPTRPAHPSTPSAGPLSSTVTAPTRPAPTPTRPAPKTTGASGAINRASAPFSLTGGERTRTAKNVEPDPTPSEDLGAPSDTEKPRSPRSQQLLDEKSQLVPEKVSTMVDMKKMSPAALMMGNLAEEAAKKRLRSTKLGSAQSLNNATVSEEPSTPKKESIPANLEPATREKTTIAKREPPAQKKPETSGTEPPAVQNVVPAAKKTVEPVSAEKMDAQSAPHALPPKPGRPPKGGENAPTKQSARSETEAPPTVAPKPGPKPFVKPVGKDAAPAVQKFPERKKEERSEASKEPSVPRRTIVPTPPPQLRETVFADFDKLELEGPTAKRSGSERSIETDAAAARVVVRPPKKQNAALRILSRAIPGKLKSDDTAAGMSPQPSEKRLDSVSDMPVRRRAPKVGGVGADYAEQIEDRRTELLSVVLGIDRLTNQPTDRKSRYKQASTEKEATVPEGEEHPDASGSEVSSVSSVSTIDAVAVPAPKTSAPLVKEYTPSVFDIPDSPDNIVLSELKEGQRDRSVLAATLPKLIDQLTQDDGSSVCLGLLLCVSGVQ